MGLLIKKGNTKKERKKNTSTRARERETFKIVSTPLWHTSDTLKVESLLWILRN